MTCLVKRKSKTSDSYRSDFYTDADDENNDDYDFQVNTLLKYFMS